MDGVSKKKGAEVKDMHIQGDPKGSERFSKNGCGIQMSQATPPKIFMFFKHNYDQLF